MVVKGHIYRENIPVTGTVAENQAKLLLSLTNRCGLLTGADATSVFLRGLNVGAAAARLAPFSAAAERRGTADDGDSDGLEDC